MTLIRATLMIGVLAALGCGSSGSGVNIDAECSIEACAASSELKAVCIDEYNDCVSGGGDPGNCLVAATETCTI